MRRKPRESVRDLNDFARKYEAGASSVRDLNDFARKSEAGASSPWGPHFTFESEAGHRKRVPVITFGLLRPEYWGSLRRELRL